MCATGFMSTITRARCCLIAERGRVGESYNIGGRLRASEHRGGARDLRADGRAAPEAVGPRERLITFVADRPGHDLRYAMDARKIASELGWAPPETFETGLAQDRALVSRPTGRGGSASAPNVYRGERLGAASSVK